MVVAENLVELRLDQAAEGEILAEFLEFVFPHIDAVKSLSLALRPASKDEAAARRWSLPGPG